MVQPVLDVQGITRRFGSVTANDDVTLRVLPGEVVGLLGHNGAGKTTLVSQVVGLLRPHSGSISVAGVDAVKHPGAARRRVAVQPQAQAPVDGLTPRQAISLTAQIRGLRGGQAREVAAELAEELDIGPWMNRRALPEGRGLSGGIRRLTGFAMAVAVPPPLIVLDEPTNDIDPARRRRLWDAVRRRADQGSGVLLVTHNVAEAEKVLDHVVVMDRGRVVADGSPSAVGGGHDGAFRLELEVTRSGADTALKNPPFAVVKTLELRRKVLHLLPSEALTQAVQWAGEQRQQGLLASFALAPATLEDAYLELTAQTQAQTQAEAAHDHQ